MTEGLHYRSGAPEVPGGGSTVRRMQLGARLRALRLAKGLSREEAGHPIRASDSKISRMELGRVGFKNRDIVDLLTLYGVDDPAERDQLLALAPRAGGTRTATCSTRGSRTTSTWNRPPI